MTEHPKTVGERSEGIILAHLLKLGYVVSIPFGNNQRYDMIVDTGERLLKAQCKTGRVVEGTVRFAVASKNGFTNVRQSYHGQVDVFLVYCPQLETVYMVPVELAGSNELSLRIEPLKKYGPTTTIKWAKDYQI